MAMDDSLQGRIPTMSEDALRAYLQHPSRYQGAAIEAVCRELERRGARLTDAERHRVAQWLNPGEEEADPLLRAAEGFRAWMRRHGRPMAGMLCGLGLLGGTYLYVTARPGEVLPSELDLLQTKRSLRDLEMVGGKANVVATELRQDFNRLWQGRNLAFTFAVLCLSGAATCAWLARERKPAPR